MKICKLCIVTGRVQGVGYRAATQRRAQALNLAGHAKNLPDGSVEVLVYGAERDINEFCDWLWEGPRLAQVNDVQCSNVTKQDLRGFAVL
ncbi:MAG: acylphosphatase [Gammaproteobacteria bacterium]|nr:acylphosphatase [Gammaproteobacteria bacterium]